MRVTEIRVNNDGPAITECSQQCKIIGDGGPAFSARGGYYSYDAPTRRADS